MNQTPETHPEIIFLNQVLTLNHLGQWTPMRKKDLKLYVVYRGYHEPDPWGIVALKYTAALRTETYDFSVNSDTLKELEMLFRDRLRKSITKALALL